MHVLTYRDQGRMGIGDNWPLAFAILFDTEEEAYQYWDDHRADAGYKAKVDILPVREKIC